MELNVYIYYIYIYIYLSVYVKLHATHLGSYCDIPPFSPFHFDVCMSGTQTGFQFSLPFAAGS